MLPESDPRELYSYTCHTCKIEKEPKEYRNNNRTSFKMVTCITCLRKQQKREYQAYTRRFYAEQVARKADEAAGIPYKLVIVTQSEKRKLAKEAKIA